MEWKLRAALGAFQIYGGAAGVVLTLQSVGSGGSVQFLFGAIAIAAYALLLGAGIALIGCRRGAVRFSRRMQLLQVPVVATGAFGYHFSAGADLSVYTGGLSGWEWSLGGHWFLNFGSSIFAIGVNVVPIAMLACLRQLRALEGSAVGMMGDVARG